MSPHGGNARKTPRFLTHVSSEDPAFVAYNLSLPVGFGFHSKKVPAVTKGRYEEGKKSRSKKRCKAIKLLLTSLLLLHIAHSKSLHTWQNLHGICGKLFWAWVRRCFKGYPISEGHIRVSGSLYQLRTGRRNLQPWHLIQVLFDVALTSYLQCLNVWMEQREIFPKEATNLQQLPRRCAASAKVLHPEVLSTWAPSWH